MRLLCTFLSIVYIAGIFLWADSPVVSDLAPFNPYSLLHIPLYGILTMLLTFSFIPFKLKRKDPMTQRPKVPMTQLMHVPLFIPGVISLIVAIADEIHQSFIPTRDASIIDVFLDGVGIVLTLFVIVQLYKKKKFLKTELTKSANDF
jgi:hypothetical protein